MTATTRQLPGYRGPHRLPSLGSPLRAAYDAAHGYWCGHECSPGCQEWAPNVDVIQVAVIAWIDATTRAENGSQEAQP